MGITVRTASARDAPEILGLLYDLGRPRPDSDQEADKFRRMVRRYIADDDKMVIVAVLDEIKLVGMAAAMLLPRLNRPAPEMYVPELVISGGHRGRGAGRMLLGECARLARAKGCHRIRLESGNQRKDSHGFYVAAGFEQSALSFTMDLA